jgi:hypothetical protein
VANSVTQTTTAATVQTTTQPFGAGAAVEEFEIVHVAGTDVLWFRVDGTSPTVAGTDAFPVRPGERLAQNKFIDNTGGATAQIRVISTTAVTYTLIATSPLRTRIK